MKLSIPLRLLSAFATALSPTFAQNAASDFTLGARQLTPLDPPLRTANTLGPLRVGVRRGSYPFEDRLLNVSWWYPAQVSEDSTPFIGGGGIIGDAFLNAPVDASSGPYPLIVFSPGLAANDDTYYFYCSNLASFGYVVVSINHLDARQASVGANPVALISAVFNMLLNNSSWTIWLLYSNWFRSTHFGLTYRPQEQQFIIDQAVAAASDTSFFLNSMIDTNNIGMSGHSLGGFYTLMKAGGMEIYCDKQLTAAESNSKSLLVTHIDICAWPEAQDLDDPQALHDPRIKAFISLAPPLFFQTEEQITRAASAINTPMMIITGNDPKQESTIAPQEQVYAAAKGPKCMVEVDKTGHLLVSEAYQFNPGPGKMVSADVKANFTEKAAVYETYSAAFFDVYLKNLTQRKTVLHEKSSSFVAKLQYDD